MFGPSTAIINNANRCLQSLENNSVIKFKQYDVEFLLIKSISFYNVISSYLNEFISSLTFFLNVLHNYLFLEKLYTVNLIEILNLLYKLIKLRG